MAVVCGDLERNVADTAMRFKNNLHVLRQEAFHEELKHHGSRMDDVSNKLQLMHEKTEGFILEFSNLKNEINVKFDKKVDIFDWKGANEHLAAAISMVRDMDSTPRLDVDARWCLVDGVLAAVRQDITAQETSFEVSKAKIMSDTDQALKALNGRVYCTYKDCATMRDCVKATAVLCSDLARNAGMEERLMADFRQKQQQAAEPTEKDGGDRHQWKSWDKQRDQHWTK